LQWKEDAQEEKAILEDQREEYGMMGVEPSTLGLEKLTNSDLRLLYAELTDGGGLALKGVQNKKDRWITEIRNVIRAIRKNNSLCVSLIAAKNSGPSADDKDEEQDAGEKDAAAASGSGGALGLFSSGSGNNDKDMESVVC
jgi:hypothetical protein